MVFAYSGHGASVVLLLFNAGPLNVTWADQHASVSAILECWFPAQSTGTALLHALTNEGGSSSPAGRLPNTWPLFADDVNPCISLFLSSISITSPNPVYDNYFKASDNQRPNTTVVVKQKPAR